MNDARCSSHHPTDDRSVTDMQQQVVTAGNNRPAFIRQLHINQSTTATSPPPRSPALRLPVTPASSSLARGARRQWPVEYPPPPLVGFERLSRSSGGVPARSWAPQPRLDLVSRVSRRQLDSTDRCLVPTWRRSLAMLVSRSALPEGGSRHRGRQEACTGSGLVRIGTKALQ